MQGGGRETVSDRRGHTVVLGGVGGDAHSVGLCILRHALAAHGYHVVFLGTQNRLKDFFDFALACNVVMISSLDGHTRYYVRDFPEQRRRHRAGRPLWYLGGNLSIGDGLHDERDFREMGFDRVFVKFVDVETVLAILAEDLAGTDPVPVALVPAGPTAGDGRERDDVVCDDRLESTAFETSRRAVLEHWSTGHAARSLDGNARFLWQAESFVGRQALANSGRIPVLIQPRCGVATVQEQAALFATFKAAGVPVISYQVDSLTRNNDYRAAELAVRDSHVAGASTLNGFPVVTHGVPALRRIAREIRLPIQTRHSTRDPRLLAEISYAGGVTAFEGGPICYNVPYYKDYPLAESIRVWQYVDRLTGTYYERFGIVLDREFFGTLTATLVPPCLAIAVDVLEALLAVRQGVRSVSLGYAEQGNRTQDIAALFVLDRIGRRTLATLGYRHVTVSVVFHEYMAAFPESVDRAEALIRESAVTAALGRATRVLVKTPVEARRIPTVADNIRGIELTRAGMETAKHRQYDAAAVAEECAVIAREVDAILASVLECDAKNLANAIVRAFRRGLIDIPFAPSRYNRGEVMTARDAAGAVRFLSVGQLAFDRELRDFHADKINARRGRDAVRSARQDYRLVADDVVRIQRHRYDGWPLTT
jgi:methylaspartate mutase epsilon subunit